MPSGFRIVLVDSQGGASAEDEEAATRVLQASLGRAAVVEDLTEADPDGPLATWLLQHTPQLGHLQRWSSGAGSTAALTALQQTAGHVEQLRILMADEDDAIEDDDDQMASVICLKLLGQLSNIRRLQLGPIGTDLEQLMGALAPLQQLRSLGLDLNQGDWDDSPLRLPAWQQLQELEIQSSKMDADHFIIRPDEVHLPPSVCSSIQRLVAPAQDIIVTDPSVSSLPSLAHLHSWTAPMYSQPQAAQQGAPSLPALQHLEVKHMYDVALGKVQRCGVGVPGCVQLLPTLTRLDSGTFYFPPRGSQLVTALPHTARSLQELEVDLCGLSQDDDLSSLAQQICLRPQLTKLVLHGSSDTYGALLAQIKSSSVRHLVFSSGVNSLEVQHLPAGLTALKWSQYWQDGQSQLVSYDQLQQGPLPRLQQVEASLHVLQQLLPLYESSLQRMAVLDRKDADSSSQQSLLGLVGSVRSSLQHLALPAPDWLTQELSTELLASTCHTIRICSGRWAASSSQLHGAQAWLAAGRQLEVDSSECYRELYGSLGSSAIRHAISGRWSEGDPALQVVYSKQAAEAASAAPAEAAPAPAIKEEPGSAAPISPGQLPYMHLRQQPFDARELQQLCARYLERRVVEGQQEMLPTRRGTARVNPKKVGWLAGWCGGWCAWHAHQWQRAMRRANRLCAARAAVAAAAA